MIVLSHSVFDLWTETFLNLRIVFLWRSYKWKFYFQTQIILVKKFLPNFFPFTFYLDNKKKPCDKKKKNSASAWNFLIMLSDVLGTFPSFLHDLQVTCSTSLGPPCQGLFPVTSNNTSLFITLCPHQQPPHVLLPLNPLPCGPFPCHQHSSPSR